MEENEIFDAFGLENPAENAQGDGDPAESIDAEGVNGREVAAPDAEEDGSESEPDGAAANGNSAQGDGGIGAQQNKQEGGAAQARDDNARFAAARRKAEAERDEAIRKIRAESDEYVSGAIKALGIISPYTGKVIETKAEYDDYIVRQSDIKRKQIVEKAGMSDAEYKEFVESLPEVRAAREAQAAAESAKKDAQSAAAKVEIGEEIKKITALDPSVASLADIAKLPSYPEIYDMVKRGYKLYDAFRLANFDGLSGKQAAAAKQAALNSVAGKGQLSRTASRGTGGASVPADIMEQYRALNPDATDAEIVKHYRKYHKS